MEGLYQHSFNLYSDEEGEIIDSCKTAGYSVTHAFVVKHTNSKLAYIRVAESIMCLYCLHFRSDPELYKWTAVLQKKKSKEKHMPLFENIFCTGHLGA